MMQLLPASRLPSIRQSQWMMLGLSLVLVMLFVYLLALGAGPSLLLAIGITVPTGLAGYLLLCRAGSSRYTTMALGMFALGGIGMLLGCMVDFGPLGLYGLLSVCRNFPLGVGGVEVYWQKLQLSPWTYAGMWLGANLGMLLSRRDIGLAQESITGQLRIMAVCNLGMLAGLLPAEFLITQLVNLSWQVSAAGLMVLAMLLCMSAGMVVVLWWHDRFFNRRHRVI